jgi:hypothetical protein
MSNPDCFSKQLAGYTACETCAGSRNRTAGVPSRTI